MNTKKVSVAIVLTLILVVLFLNRARIGQISNRNQMASDQAKIKQHDEDTFRNLEKSTPDQIYAALIRGASSNPKDALSSAKKLFDSKDIQVKSGVAFLLAARPSDEMLPQLKLLMKDPDPRVKNNLARGLSAYPNPQKMKFIQEFLSTPGIGDADRVEAFFAAHESAATASEKEPFLNQIIKFAGNEKNSELALFAINRATNMAPTNPTVIELVKKYITSNRWPSFTPLGIRYLAVLHSDSWLESNFLKLKETKDSQTKVALIGSLRLVCPISRWIWLDAWFQSDKTPEIRKSILSEVVLMPGREAEEFIQKVMKLKDLSEDEQVQASGALRAIKDSKSTDPCHRS